MPVSGRPTKAALLKTSQGSSGPLRKGFQKVWKAVGTGLTSPANVVGVVLRVRKSARSEPAKRRERTTTESNQARGTCSLTGCESSGEGWGCRGEFDADGIGCAFAGIVFQKLGA